MQVSVLQKQLAAKGGEADSLSRRLSAINNLTTAFEQVSPQLASNLVNSHVAAQHRCLCCFALT